MIVIMRRGPVEQGADAADPEHDQDQVGQRADGDDQQHVPTLQALPQHEGVLATDRDDQGQTGGQAGERGEEHATNARSRAAFRPVQKSVRT